MRQAMTTRLLAATAALLLLAAPARGFDQAAIAHLDAEGECLDCDLSQADLQGADLEDATLDGADLSGADLSGAVLSAASLADEAFFEQQVREPFVLLGLQRAHALELLRGEPRLSQQDLAEVEAAFRRGDHGSSRFWSVTADSKP